MALRASWMSKRSRDGLAVEDRADLVLRQAVALDGERPANGADPVGAPQPEVLENRGRFGPDADPNVRINAYRVVSRNAGNHMERKVASTWESLADRIIERSDSDKKAIRELDASLGRGT